MKTVVYGNGSIARILFSYAKNKLNIAGFTVDDACIAKGQNEFCGLPIVPFSRAEEFFDPKEHKMIIAMGFIEMNELREEKYKEASKKGYSFASYLHEAVIIHDDVTIGENSIILDNVSIHPGCKLGHSAFITSNVNIGHDCIIDELNWINSGVALAGGVHLKKGCFMGVNSSVSHGVVVGKRNFVGANTLVSKNTKDDEVYLSEPCKLFRLKSKPFLKFSKILD